MEPQKPESKTSYPIWHLIMVGLFFTCGLPMIRVCMQRVGLTRPPNQPAPQAQPALIPATPAPVASARSLSPPQQNLPVRTSPTGTLPSANTLWNRPALNDSLRTTATVQYPSDFEAAWGPNGAAEFVQSYENGFTSSNGVKLNDQQRKYIKDIILPEFKEKLFQKYQRMGNTIPENQLDLVVKQISAEVLTESGPTHSVDLIEMMDGVQVARLNSFLSGVSIAHPGATDGSYAPVFEYLWSGNQGDDDVVADMQREIESAVGFALNEAQVAYIRNTIIPTWKTNAAAAFAKLDLASGNVTGSELVAALTDHLFKSSTEHMQQINALMDANQKRLMQLQSAGESDSK